MIPTSLLLSIFSSIFHCTLLNTSHLLWIVFFYKLMVIKILKLKLNNVTVTFAHHQIIFPTPQKIIFLHNNPEVNFSHEISEECWITFRLDNIAENSPQNKSPALSLMSVGRNQTKIFLSTSRGSVQKSFKTLALVFNVSFRSTTLRNVHNV